MTNYALSDRDEYEVAELWKCGHYGEPAVTQEAAKSKEKQSEEFIAIEEAVKCRGSHNDPYIACNVLKSEDG